MGRAVGGATVDEVGAVRTVSGEPPGYVTTLRRWRTNPTGNGWNKTLPVMAYNRKGYPSSCAVSLATSAHRVATLRQYCLMAFVNWNIAATTPPASPSSPPTAHLKCAAVPANLPPWYPLP